MSAPRPVGAAPGRRARTLVEELLTRRTAEAAAVLLQPGGLLAACREAWVQGDTALMARLADEATTGWLDDLTEFGPGPAPSERLRALVRVAEARCRSAWGPVHVDDGRDHVDDGGGHADESGLWADLAEALDEPWGGPPGARVAVVLDRHHTGQLAHFEARIAPGRRGCRPDLARNPFTQFGPAFLHAVEAAFAPWADRAAVRRLGVRWSLVSTHQQPVPVVDGPSIGLGAAVAFRVLFEGDELDGGGGLPPLDPAWAYTGAVGPEGTVLPLLGDGDLRPYENKLRAAARHRLRALFVPAADQPVVAELAAATADAVDVWGVDRASDVHAVGERALRAARAYHQAVVSPELPRPPPRLGRRELLVGGLSTVVGLTLLGGLVARRWAPGPPAPGAGDGPVSYQVGADGPSVGAPGATAVFEVRVVPDRTVVRAVQVAVRRERDLHERPLAWKNVGPIELPAGEPVAIAFPWEVPVDLPPGRYRLDVGIFSADRGHFELWADAVVPIAVGGPVG